MAQYQAPKTKEQLEAEVPEGGKRLDRDTKVIARGDGYYDQLRAAGDVFWVNKGTIMEPNCWFTPVSDNTATSEEEAQYEDLTVADLKIALAEKGIDFTGVTKKSDLIGLLAEANAEDDLA